ncbi:cytochrome C peroxidase [Elstera litoralis]|uniref:Cytochrome C peroxidase n=1 Tax=Elstera litoralis TaxID=552518 RepID=A0A0F3IVW8_9PROT|nr:methanobactin export MATE transporter MbnM [Elstera litoralis]KJV10683.1 cytochrome C peroxidase [Elstera litoralis]
MRGWVRALALIAVLAAPSAGAETPWVWDLPAWVPRPRVPADNPMTVEKVALGRQLFYDKQLSLNGKGACASCHIQAKAFTDGRKVGVGVTGEKHVRNSMGLANVAYVPVLTWANPLLHSLEQQALVPMFGENPVELGLAGQEEALFARLKADPRYPALFQAAFPAEGGTISLRSITQALAAFERSIVSFSSPYDRYRYGNEPNAISAAAKRGEALFFSERLECFHCHGGITFSNAVTHERLAFVEAGFHQTGLYNLDGKGAYPANNPGAIEVTGEAQDMGRFRTPSLRNVAVTAPYMHDGSIATLDAAIDHYAAGGRAKSAQTDQLIVGFKLNKSERADLIAFLRSLTDQRLLTTPAYGPPK